MSDTPLPTPMDRTSSIAGPKSASGETARALNCRASPTAAIATYTPPADGGCSTGPPPRTTSNPGPRSWRRRRSPPTQPPLPYLVFRVGQAWLAFPATSLREITEPSVIRSVPHRPREILLGLVNVRGELHPCVSLHTLFGEEAAAHRLPDRALPGGAVGGRRLGVSGRSSGRHARRRRQEIEPLPVTLTNVAVVYTQGLFHSGDKTVAIIDENLLFGALARRIA